MAQDDCEEETREVRQCAEERRHLSQQLSDTRSALEDLQHTVKGLESDLKDQKHACREAVSETQSECSENIQDINTKLQAAKQELGDSEERISFITADLLEAQRLQSQVQEDFERCESTAKAEKDEHAQHLSDLQRQLTESKAAQERTEKDISSSVSAVREEAAKLRTELDMERMNCKAASAKIQEENDVQLHLIQQQLQAAAADHKISKSDAETLTVELQSCQASLSQELQVRLKAEAQAALQENLHTKVSSDLVEKEQELMEHTRGMKAEIEHLKSKISQMSGQLDFAEKAYLPLWSIPYYDEAAKQAVATKEQARIYYEREIATGKAFRETKQTVMDASNRVMIMAEPHVSKARTALTPMMKLVVAKFKYAKEAIGRQLQQEKYRAFMKSVRHAQEIMLESWLSAKSHVADIYDSDMVKQAMDDLTRIYTLLLGADVSGSGIDASIPPMLARYTLFAVPLLFVMPVLLLCCSRRRTQQQPPPPPKPRAQPASSKGGDGKRSKKR